MKKILLILLVCFSYVAGSSQAIIQRGTSAVTVQDDRWKGRLNAFLPAYTDTTAANLQKGIDSCGAIIFTYNYGLWYRACSPKRWVQVIPGSSPTSDSLYWRIGGNNLSALASDRPHMGSTDSSDVNFITNNQIRITIPSNGIVRNGSTNLKNIKYDTLTKYLYYYDDGGSGGSGITSLSQGFGMNNSANPITTTGTVAVDSGVISTRNYVDSFYNNITQLNDSTFTIDRENGTQDTIQILTGIANVIDSLRRLPGSTIVQALKNGVWISQYIDSVGGGGGGSGTVITVSRTNGYGISASVANPTTTPDITIAIDSATVFPQIRSTIPSSTTDTTSLSNRINLKVNISDTSSMLTNYRNGINSNTAAIALKVNISDTGSMLNPYLRKSDTTSLSSRINLKVNIADTSSMLTPYLRKIDTTAMLLPYLRKVDTSSMLSPYLRKIDTTVFARKSMPAYSIRANNTNGVADATNFTYRSVAAQSISAGVPVWTAGTAPSGAENHQYTWSQIGKQVTMSFYLTYVTAGATCTAVRFPLPSDMPAPLELAGTGAADEFLYIGSAYIGTAKTTTPAVMSRVTIEVNSGDTGWDVFTTGTSVSGRVCYGTIIYTAQ